MLSVGAAVLMGLLVLVSPFAAATPKASAPVTLTAPYEGSAANTGYFEVSGCGYSFSFPVAPDLNLTTGVFTGSVKAAAKSCGTGATTVEAEVGSDLFQGQEWKTTTGNHTVTVHWTMKYSLTLTNHSGAADQYSYAYADMSVSADLEDATNFSFFDIGDAFFDYGSQTSPGTHSHTETVTLKSPNLHLVAGHEYWVAVSVEAYVQAEVSPGSSSASASANMGSSGEFANLTSIVVP